MTAAPPTAAAPAPMARLPRRIALSYGVGAIGTGVFSTVPGLLLLFYLTDVIGVAAGLASLVLFVPKIWDAALNPLIGTLSDRTTTRSGGRRPYILAGAVIVPLSFALLFSSPDLGSTTRTALFVALVYTVAMTGYALFQVPWVAMPAEMTDDYHERTRLMSSRMVLLTLGILIGGALAPVLSGGKEGGADGYRFMGVVIAVVLAISLFTTWYGTREAAFSPADTSPRPTVRVQLALIRSNPAFLVLFWAYLLQAVATGAMLAGAPYVATYVLGDSELAALLFVFLVVPSAFVMPLWRRLSLRVGKLTGYVAATALFGLTGLTLVLAEATPKPVIFLQMGLLGVGYAGMQLFPYSMLPDALQVTGTSRAGVFTGVWQGGETVGFALGPALYGGVLALTGFVSSAADERVTQPDSAITGLVLGFSVLPAVLVLLSIPLLRRYAATDAQMSASRTEASA